MLHSEEIYNVIFLKISNITNNLKTLTTNVKIAKHNEMFAHKNLKLQFKRINV